jgi:hypothetical protein
MAHDLGCLSVNGSDLTAGDPDERPQRIVYGVVIDKDLGNIGIDLHEIRSCAVAAVVLAANAARHLGKVVLRPKVV